MISPKDIPFIQVIAPVAVGAVAWFGLNYAWLSPSIITPRIATVYYMPQCTANVANLIEADKEEVETLRAAAIEQANATVAQLGSAVASTPANFMQWYLDASAGMGMELEGDREFREQYLGEDRSALNGMGASMGGNVVGMFGSQIAENQFNEWQREFTAQRKEERRQQKYSDVASYCGCNFETATDDRFEMAMHSATLRMYRPDALNALDRLDAFVDECGKPPVI